MAVNHNSNATLEVREQTRLGAVRLFEICHDSVRHRLLRSLVTLAIIVLAIAFLTSIMLEGYVGQAVRDTVRSESNAISTYARTLSALSYGGSAEALVRANGEWSVGSAAYKNIVGWGAMEDEQMAGFIAQCQRATHYLDFFSSLPVGRRVLLVEDQRGLAIFDWLATGDNLERFGRRLAGMKSVRLPGGTEGLRQLIDQWPSFREQLARVRAGYQKTRTAIAEISAPQTVRDAMAAIHDEAQLTGYLQKLQDVGFHIEDAERERLMAGIQHERDRQWAFALLKKRPVRSGWPRAFQEKFSTGDALRSCAAEPKRVDWMLATLSRSGDDGGLDRTRFLAVAEEFHRRAKLLEAEAELLGRYGMRVGLSSKSIWLICVSFMVCVVGIANAMLMSVLERFKEIATMKCLGARNQTIAFLFITESAMLGLIGGLIGIAIGLFIVVVRQYWNYGEYLFVQVPWASITMVCGACFACSLLLATLAAIYPAGVASRMAPLEAMRVD